VLDVNLGRSIAALRRRRRPVLLGSLGRTTPVGEQWGYDRGTPVDRWYIERFLAAHRAVIFGRVLEVKDTAYTERFGHDLVERGVLDVDPGNRAATYVADLAAADDLPAAHFDCFVLTQTLQYVYDVPSAVSHVHRILRPGGVVLATLPVVSRVTDPPLTDYWRFTVPSAARLFGDVFGPERVVAEGRGNVLSQVAFLEGLAAEDLRPRDLAVDDARFPLVACVLATRAGA
jgi:SAM-dependent methyltransferase